MLTIRIIYPNGGELVKTVHSVMRRPGNETETGSACITYFENDRAIDVYDAQVYVMNENGKTIADYLVNSEWKEIKDNK